MLQTSMQRAQGLPFCDKCQASQPPAWLNSVIVLLGLAALVVVTQTGRATTPTCAGDFGARCRDILDGLDIPQPFELVTFLANVAWLRGRRIYVRPFTARHGFSGAWIRTRHADYIYHDAHTTYLHRAHIVLHEVGHMLLGHEFGRITDSELIGVLTPKVNAHLIRLMPGHAGYGAAQEREAETLASIVLERASQSGSVLVPLPRRGGRDRLGRRPRTPAPHRGQGLSDQHSGVCGWCRHDG